MIKENTMLKKEKIRFIRIRTVSIFAMFFSSFTSLVGCDTLLRNYQGDSSIIGSNTEEDSSPSSECIDNDNDGYGFGCGTDLDCRDDDPFINPGVSEICNGIDDDCDELVDEGTAKGEECTFGYEGCELVGHISCSNYIQECVIDDSFQEVCNGIDDNCNGEIDEGNPGGGDECDTGDPGICNIGEWTCVIDTESPGIGCIPNITPGTYSEICDGVDNDCDGSIDEDNDGNPISVSCYTGLEGTSGEGLCSDGTWTCLEGRFGPCIGQTRPTDEICNGLDDDCDGIADEGMPEECACDPNVNTLPENCYTGPVNTENEGLCIGGTAECDADTNLWEECTGEILPTDELCDGLDNDCDGTIDEDLHLGESCTVGIGQCQNTGTIECANDHGVRCNATENASSDEICDGIDNDCDGIIDDVATVNTSCSMGTGTCETTGVYVCNIEDNTVVCNASLPNSAGEVCDGIDNDCDGQVDEDFNIDGVCTVGIGACERTGTFTCSFDTTVVCNVQPGGPGVEICDDIDNDCDGEIDEGFGIDNLCVGIGAYLDGKIECNAIGDAICSTNPNGSEYLPASEICDGIDNDCDGETDEYFGIGGICNSSCGEGVYECNPTNPTAYGICSTSYMGSVAEEEVCDGIDNDCNGEIDNGFPDTDYDFTKDCMDDDDDNDGSLDIDDCAPQNPGISPNGVEQCNGLDDDCNEQVDDNFNFTPELSNNQNGVCNGTRKACAGINGWQEPDYSTVDDFEIVEVSCDGLDNDCDGSVDEDTDFQTPADNQNGVCAGIKKVCSGGVWQEPDYTSTIGAIYEATETLCDALDNDCDGIVDEGCP